MAKIDLPQHWQDWASWVLALWLLISPWALGFSLDAPATHVAVVFGAVLLALEVVTLSAFRKWEEWANVLVGLCLIGAVVLLPVVETAARANFIIVGVVVIALAFFELMDVDRPSTRSRDSR